SSDAGRTASLFWRSVRVLLLVMFPLTLIIVTLAPEGLDLWLDAEFARESAAVLRWLAIGVFINSLAQVPYTVLQGIGRPDLTGKLHIAELPLYLGLLWVLVGRFGIEGAAAAWVLRIGLDTLALFALADRQLAGSRAVAPRVLPLLGATVAVLCLALPLAGVATKLVFLAVVLSLFGAAGWWKVLQADERAALRALWQGRGRTPASLH